MQQQKMSSSSSVGVCCLALTLCWLVGCTSGQTLPTCSGTCFSDCFENLPNTSGGKCTSTSSDGVCACVQGAWECTKTCDCFSESTCNSASDASCPLNCNDKDSGLSTGEIWGIVITSIVGCLCLCCCCAALVAIGMYYRTLQSQKHAAVDPSLVPGGIPSAPEAAMGTPVPQPGPQPMNPNGPPHQGFPNFSDMFNNTGSVSLNMGGPAGQPPTGLPVPYGRATPGPMR